MCAFVYRAAFLIPQNNIDAKKEFVFLILWIICVFSNMVGTINDCVEFYI